MSSGASEQALAVGWRAREVKEELPQLRLAATEVSLSHRGGPLRSSPTPVRERLAALSDRVNGAKAIALRREPVPAAYRVFFHHIGLDPDVVRTPIEAAILDRLLDGGFVSQGLLSDILLVALVDTGVPVWALDRGSLDGPLGIRLSGGETLGRGEDAEPVQGGRIVVADSSAALAVLFERPAAAHRPKSRTRDLTLYALQVPGVPWLAIEESLWICRSALQAEARPDARSRRFAG